MKNSKYIFNECCALGRCLNISRDGQTQSCGAGKCVIDSAGKVPGGGLMRYMLERWMAIDREVERPAHGALTPLSLLRKH